MPDSMFTRRRVLGLGLGAAATMMLAACGDDEDDEDTVPTGQQPASTATTGQSSAPTAPAAATTAPAVATATPAVATPMATSAPAATTTAAAPAASPPTDDDVQILVGDVVGYSLESDGWDGPFGWVRLTIHPGHFDGGEVWFIRTDSSDQTHAQQEGSSSCPCWPTR